MQPEDRVDRRLGIVQFAANGCAHECARCCDWHAATDAVPATGPAGVDEPRGGTRLLEALAEHPGVDAWALRQERCAEAGREGRLWLGHANFGAGQLGGVARQEVVHRLVGCEARDGRQDAVGVGRQQHDRGRRAGALLWHGARDRADGIRHARVLGDRLVGEVDLACNRIEHNVLDDRAEHFCRRVDLGLGLGGQVDRLGVAATFDVEDAIVGPAVLVVADQGALGIGRECRLAGAGKAEEDGDATIVGDVGRAVHRQDAMLGQAVVHVREDGLLDLAGVARTADQDLAGGKVERHETGRARAVDFGVGLELRGMENDDFGGVDGDLCRRRVDEHRLCEQDVPGGVANHANCDAVLGVRASEGVEDVDVALVEEGGEVGANLRVVGGRDRRVDRSPPDALIAAGLLHDELVFRRASGVGSGVDDQRATVTHHASVGSDRVLVELSGRQVPVGSALRSETVCVEID